ncbi:hypothetical protein O9K51_05393 [Purpureocillium lavendulum]|uniref:Uncharacterized protein n=1 Tax=Purpureocillium lavendulum TaxID=1247861 RepID=A0AB34FTY4_9HYPO|nr:hypothetical protein O9K51_05393 [Purpureocillium lavendulum]
MTSYGGDPSDYDIVGGGGSGCCHSCCRSLDLGVHDYCVPCATNPCCPRSSLRDRDLAFDFDLDRDGRGDLSSIPRRIFREATPATTMATTASVHGGFGGVSRNALSDKTGGDNSLQASQTRDRSQFSREKPTSKSSDGLGGARQGSKIQAQGIQGSAKAAGVEGGPTK